MEPTLTSHLSSAQPSTSLSPGPLSRGLYGFQGQLGSAIAETSLSAPRTETSLPSLRARPDPNRQSPGGTGTLSSMHTDACANAGTLTGLICVHVSACHPCVQKFRYPYTFHSLIQQVFIWGSHLTTAFSLCFGDWGEMDNVSGAPAPGEVPWQLEPYT